MLRRALSILLLAVAGASPAAAAEVRSGPLAAVVTDDPWRLRFVQRGIELAEHPGQGTGPTGSLGFRTSSGWAHATRVTAQRADGDAVELDVATTDAARTLRVRLEPAGGGIVRLTAQVVGDTAAVTHAGIAFAAADGERYLGFGERYNAVDQRGLTIENYVAEGPYEEDEEVLITPFVSPASYHPRADATYFPMPWLLSTRGYGVLLEGSRISEFRLGSDDPEAWSLEVQGSGLSLLVMAGPRPAGVLRRLTTITGRQPEPAAPWFFGPWFQTGGTSEVPEELETGYVSALRSGDAPVSVAETHFRYLPCGQSDEARERERARSERMHRAGLAILTYMREVLCVEHPRYDEASARGVFLEDPLGRDYVFTGYDGGRQPPVNTLSLPDFTAPATPAFYSELLADIVADGHDGWMEDFGEAVPLDSRAANGMTGDEMHNLYPVLYHRAGYEFAAAQDRPIARFIRSGWTGVHPYAQIVWTGDPSVDWGFDGLSSVPASVLTMGLSGISTIGSDIGGFHALGENRLTPELLKRWIQTGALTPVMRTKGGGVHVPPSTRPQVWEPEILPTWRRWAKLHTQLNGYLLGADAVYRRTGLPIVRHLALAFPGDPQAVRVDDAWLFGPDLLAAPVTAQGQRRREVYLPAGRWVDLWSSARYHERSGGLELRGARVLPGRRRVTLAAPLEEAPLLVRAGSVLPLLPREVDTLADYGAGTPGLVRAADRAGRMELLAWPRGRRVARFNEGERLVSARRIGRWTLRFRTARARVYELQAAIARPCSVTIGGRKVGFRHAEGILRATFRARRGEALVARRCD